jgi:hypothetical protein
VTWLVAAGAVALGLLLTLGFLGRRRRCGRPEQRGMLLFTAMSLLFVILFEITFSHLQEGGLFDRHILTAALPLILLAHLLSTANKNGEGAERLPASAATARLASRIATGLLLAAFAYFGITATHDYLAWNRLRWELGNGLLAQKVDPLSVSGGFEFNGWNNYDTFRERGNIGKVYYWWYDRLDYVITMEPQENYHQLKRLEYYSWLHHKKLPIYLLRRDN